MSSPRKRKTSALRDDHLDEVTKQLLQETIFPLDAFDDAVQAWASNYADNVGADVSLFLLPLLAVINFCVRRNAVIRLPGSRESYVNPTIFVLACAPSASGKSEFATKLTDAARNIEIALQEDHRNYQNLFLGGSFNAMRVMAYDQQPDGARSVLGIFDEFVTFMTWLGGQSSDSTQRLQDMAQLTLLYDGQPWARHLVNNTRKQDKRDVDDDDGTNNTDQRTWIPVKGQPSTNITLVGWTQPKTMIENLLNDFQESLGMWARFDFALGTRKFIDDITRMPALNVDVSLEDMLMYVFKWHRGGDPVFYEFDADAAEFFAAQANLAMREIHDLQGFCIFFLSLSPLAILV
jgi:hypothetical protein